MHGPVKEVYRVILLTFTEWIDQDQVYFTQEEQIVIMNSYEEFKNR